MNEQIGSSIHDGGLTLNMCPWWGCGSTDIVTLASVSTCAGFLGVDENQRSAVLYCKKCKRYFGADYRFTSLSVEDIDGLEQQYAFRHEHSIPTLQTKLIAYINETFKGQTFDETAIRKAAEGWLSKHTQKKPVCSMAFKPGFGQAGTLEIRLEAGTEGLEPS